jgi:hypothetical protein
MRGVLHFSNEFLPALFSVSRPLVGDEKIHAPG